MPVAPKSNQPPSGIRAGNHFSPVHVRCYAGYRADETPRAFRPPGGPRLEILQILKRWTEPRYRFFRVAASDGRTWLLRQNARTFQWEVRLD